MSGVYHFAGAIILIGMKMPVHDGEGRDDFLISQGDCAIAVKISMKTIVLEVMLLVLGGIGFCQDDADTYLRVEKARAEVPSCQKLLESSKATGSIPMLLTSYAEIDKQAGKLEHCGFVFRITGDVKRANDAGDEGDRWDAVGAQQMKRYLQGKKLWADFLTQDCREGSSRCGTTK